MLLLLLLGPLHAGSRGPADQHLPRAWGLCCPAAAPAPGQAHRAGTCQLEPAQVWVPACPGVFLLPPHGAGHKERRVARLCRERGQKQDGNLCLALISRFPWSPSTLWSLVWWCVALLRKPCWVPSPAAPPAAPRAIQLQVSVLHLCCPRGTQPARLKLGGSNGCTYAAPPPPTPPHVPQVLAGPAAAVATLAVTAVPLGCSELPWRAAPLPKSRGCLWSHAGILGRQHQPGGAGA